MSSFLIWCSLVTPVILRSQLIFAARILFSSCFRIDQHSDLYRKIGCLILSHILILVFFVSFLLFHMGPSICDFHKKIVSFTPLPRVQMRPHAAASTWF